MSSKFLGRGMRTTSGVLSLGVPGVPPWHPQILADQLTLSQPGGADYALTSLLAPPNFQTFRRPWNWPSKSTICIFARNHIDSVQSSRRKSHFPEHYIDDLNSIQLLLYDSNLNFHISSKISTFPSQPGWMGNLSELKSVPRECSLLRRCRVENPIELNLSF